MRREQLLALQERVIHALSGEESVAGVDSARLELVRDLARAKRIAKVESVLPRTCRALGGDFSRLSGDFARAMPPTSFRSRADGLAFYRFLARRGVSPELRTLAYCELALTALGMRSSREDPGCVPAAPRAPLSIRRAPGVRVRAFRFDVRAFFESDPAEMPATVRPARVHLAIIADPPAGTPRVAELSPGLFDFLRAIRTWRALPAVTDEDMQLLRHWQQQGLLEIAQEAGSGARVYPSASGGGSDDDQKVRCGHTDGTGGVTGAERRAR